MDDANDAALRVQLLGPVRAWRSGRDIAVGPPLRRAVFAMLASRPDQAITRTELIDGLWGQDPPASAVNGMHIYVSGLRRVLEPDRARRTPSRILVASGNGYLLRLGSGHLDVRAFEQDLARARSERAAGDLSAAARMLDQAVLWEAAPLFGVPGPWAELERTRLTELRLTAVEEYIGVMLARGCHAQVAPQLTVLVRRYPLRERFHGQLMLALYRSGRQAEALAAFAQARKILIGELGVEPGAELKRLHRQVLAADTALDIPGPGTTTTTTAAASARHAAPVPQELPGDVSAFTGRDDELALLDRMLAGAVSRPGTAAQPAGLRIFLISGTAGVGKTALALRWAHRARDAFPDGQLYVDLRGYDSAQPVFAADALARFLRSLGASGQNIPADPDERSARYRSLLARRQMLILLDNAATIEQVRPLLPGTRSCTVVVTSRDELSGLVARDGALRLELGLLPAADAVGLLRILIGERVDAEPSAAAVLASQCARLPLALRVAADLAICRQTVSVAQLAEELSGEQQRLELLDAGGDQRTAVRAVISWSFRHLPADAARAFRLLGLHPGPSTDSYATAALFGCRVCKASQLLDQLASAHLIEPGRAGRYRMHDLLRAYAGHLASVQETEGAVTAALTRVFDYYLAVATGAMDCLNPAERADAVPACPLPGNAPPVASAAAARAWLDTERATLISITAFASVRGHPWRAAALAGALFRYFDDGQYGDALVMHGHACEAAIAVGDRAAEAGALCDLGVAEWRLGRWSQAATRFTQALGLFSGLGDHAGQARAHGNLGLVCWRLGRYEQAASHSGQALTMFREAADQSGEARALGNLGVIDWQQGRYQEAASHHRRALALYRELGESRGEAIALGNLGSAYFRQGRYQAAARLQEQALHLFRDLGYRLGEARALADLGAARHHEGRHPEAVTQLQQALTIFRDLADRHGEAETVNQLGELELASGLGTQARGHFTMALRLTRELASPYEEARAHAGLARCHQSAGDLNEARIRWEAALALFTALSAPEACEARACLAALRGPTASIKEVD